MEHYEQLISIIALSMGASWASGINLYAAIAMLGLSATTGSMDLPPDLQILENPLVIGAAIVMYGVEFFADKIPGVDTAWDTIHTFVRIPAGALLAAGAVGEVGPAMEISAALLGGGLATATHLTKAGSRAVINTSPEPVSNWAASITEDVAVFGGLWAALHHPVLFLIFMVFFLFFMAWLLPRLWGAIRSFARMLANLFSTGRIESPPHPSALPPPANRPSPKPRQTGTARKIEGTAGRRNPDPRRVPKRKRTNPGGAMIIVSATLSCLFLLKVVGGV